MQKRIVVWWFLVFQIVCFFLNETNINIAIVSMVAVSCARNSTLEENAVCSKATSFFQNNSPTTSSCTARTGFAWSEAEQNMILSGSNWLGYIAMFLGGVLAEKFGPKRVAGVSLLMASIVSSFIPILAYRGPFVMACIRAVQGFLTKLSYPSALNKMMGSWCPVQERGRFHMFAYIGSAAGNFLSDLGFGYISEYIHWQYVFYLTSIYGIIVNVLWFTLVYDSPEQHPTISSEERSHIKCNSNFVHATDKTIPWKSIFTSTPFIICVMAHTPRVWLYRMPITYLPNYFNTIYGLNANQIGILTSTWQLMAAAVVPIGGYAIDKSIERNILTVTGTRKLGTVLGSIVPSIALIASAYAGCHLEAVIVCLTLYSIFETCSSFGPSLAIIDLSPNYCGILYGIVDTIVSLQNFLLSLLINYFSNIWNTEELWTNEFSYTGLYVIVASVPFIIYGTAEPQRWNYQKLNKTNGDISNNSDSTEADSLL